MPFLFFHVLLAFCLDLAHTLRRSDRDLALEVLLLRQQLRLYERRTKRPRTSRWEKVALGGLAARLPDLARVALVFTPATLLRWHREAVRRKWTFANAPSAGRPATSATCVELVLRLARENPSWGYGKIQGELRKLGHHVSRSTIKRTLRRHRLPPAPERNTQSWRTFLAHYREHIVACDFFTVETLFLKTIHVLFFIELGTRRVHLAGCTAKPEAAWVTQQARQFTWHLHDGEPGAAKFLIHDRDGKFAAPFDTVFASEGVAVVHTPPQAPNANAHAERWVRSAREECLDRLLILNERHLALVLKHYVDYYNHRRPHQGRGQTFPVPLAAAPTLPVSPVRIQRRPILGGLINDYDIAA